MGKVRLDEVGYWSEVKLDIVRKYATAYSKILRKQVGFRGHVYIDAFAGAGVHISRRTGAYIPGSPLNALNVEPPFREFHFIDVDGGRAEALRRLVGPQENVFVYEGDSNVVLLRDVFPRARYEDFRRALCLLDPYGLHLKWEVVRTAGQMRSVEVFLNFPVMDMHMNVLRRNPDKVQKSQVRRMDAFWGDASWRGIAYTKTPGLFGDIEEKEDIGVVVKAYQKRLREVAGFRFVPDPMPMRNTKGGVVYYLFFASPNEKGAKIVEDICRKYQSRGLPNGA